MRLRLRVKEVAKDQGISMAKLHIKSEVAYSTGRRLFRDPFAEVTTTTIHRLAEALGVPPTHLLEDGPDEQE
jgi:lambda repressor-like predicted transcriptional regulator